MKVRKLAVALALAGGLGSGVAQALGLGEIELQSYLNEPLDAEIRLPQSRGVDPTDVFVNIAPESAYETVGLSRNQFLSKLRFQVVTENDGSLAVRVSSREPLREPYLNFLLELTWPNGRLMREYAVLVDPPVYAEESGVQESVTAPTAATPAPQSSETRSPESVRRQAEAEASVQRGYQGSTFGPTTSSDTLWTIAAQVRPNDSVTTQQVMIAIQDLNPDAFIGGNINRLKRGEVLRVPTLEQVQSRTRAEATRIVGQQNREFQSPQRTVDATDTQVAQAASSAAAASGDELKLIVADSGARETSEGGSAGGDGQLPGGVDAGAAVAMEELESARRENEELSGRVQDLEGQIETLQRLLELKNSQLADLQTMTQEGDEPATGELAAQGEGVEGEEELAEAGEEVIAGEDVVEPEMAAESDAEAEGGAETGEETLEAEAGSDQGAEVADEVGVEVASADEATDQGLVAQDEAADVVAEDGANEGSAASESEQKAVEPEVAEVEPVEAAPVTQPSVEAQQPVKTPVAEKGPIAGIIDAIRSNFLYQVALGGGLILLLLLLLVVARRNANREKEFYEQLNQESDADAEDDDIELTLDDDQESDKDSALAEADNYLAFGRHDQAAQSLEEAISREPSRTDLRLKLLGIYAETQNQASFDKQYAELESLDDEQAMVSARELRVSLEEAEAIPSIDDLESQLRSDSFGSFDTEAAEDSAAEVNQEGEVHLSDELLADQYDAEQEEQVSDEFAEFDTDFANFNLNEDEESKSDVEQAEAAEASESEQAEQASSDDAIEFDLSDVSMESEAEAAPVEEESEFASLSLDTDEESNSLDFELEDTAESSSEESAEDLGADLADLEDAGSDLDNLEEGLDFDLGEPAPEAEAVEAEPAQEEDLDSLESLDESFLDELDAELDKVAGDDEESSELTSEDGGLDELELDVSDEDLALMEEFSESSDSESSAEDLDVPALDEELSLEDALERETASVEDNAEEELAGIDELEDFGSLDNLEEPEVEGSVDEAEIPVTSDELADEPKLAVPADIDEGDLGEDDDFDFLAGTDEAATKLDLARAYIEMGDADGARDILEEVSLEGNEEQKAEAQDLLKNLA